MVLPKTIQHKYAGIELDRWLTQFSDAVQKKEYSRISYDIWRKLHKMCQNDVEVKIGVKDKDHFNIMLTPKEGGKANAVIFTEENSFAMFLAEEIFAADMKELRNKIMATTYSINTDGNIVLNDGTTYSTTVNSNPYLYYSNNIVDASFNINSISDEIEKINKILNDLTKENKTEMATTTPTNMFNFDFGPVNGTGIRMSMYGYAIPNEAGKYVSYDAEHDRMMDVQILNFNCDGIFYKVPKALNKVVEGDVVFHNGTPVFVEDVDDNRLTVIDPKTGTEKVIMPACSPFGFDYVSTLVSLMDGFCGDCEPDEDNPFGNMLPFLFLGNSNGSNNLIPLMLMANGEKLDFSNPLMLLAMNGGGNFDTSNPLVLMALMKGFNK